MAQRIQPDRHVKKKRKMEVPESFDLVGKLLGNYGMTGENLAHQIFCSLDFSSIQDSRLVCKSWNIFLSNDRKLWMELLRQTQPFFEFLSNQFQNGFSTIASKHQFSSNKNSTANETKKNWIKEFFDSIEIRSKNNNFSCQKMIQLFRKTHVVHAALLMPRPLPFTGPKMFCAGSIFLSQSQNLTAFSASSKTFVPTQKTILLNANHLFVLLKMFVTCTICE